MGKGGAGKTDWITTMKPPVLLLSTDPNTEDVIEKIYGVPSRDIDPRELRLVHVPYPAVGFETDEADVTNEALDAWDVIVDALRPIKEGNADPMPASVGIDTGSELNTLCILKEFGRTDKIAPGQRKMRMGNVNTDFKGIFRMLERAGVHVCIAHRCKQRWEEIEIQHGRKKGEVEEKPIPGVYDRVGFREMENIVNVEVLALFDETREGKLSNRFGMKITKCNLRPSLVGEEYWGKEEVDGQMVRVASFPFLATLIYPKTKLSDWE